MQYVISYVNTAGVKGSTTLADPNLVEPMKMILRARGYTRLDVVQFSGEGRCKRLAA